MIGHDDLKDFECPICLEFCKDAVESECCAHAFCSVCADAFVRQKKDCPCCRSGGFKARESRLMRRIISQIKVECSHKGCQEKLQNADKEKHEEECKHRLIVCKHCKEDVLLRNIYEHSLDKHREEVEKLVLGQYVSQDKTSMKSSLKSAVQSYDPLAKVKNGRGRDAAFGQHNKYYCGGLLGFKCKCCDGSCGPTNGENCIDCMRLDIEFHKLGPGTLLNAAGHVSKIEDGKAYCGVLWRTIGEKKPCSLKEQCNYCICLTNSLPRYQTLL